jgi:hypothetical protein
MLHVVCSDMLQMAGFGFVEEGAAWSAHQQAFRVHFVTHTLHGVCSDMLQIACFGFVEEGAAWSRISMLSHPPCH